MAHSSPVCPSTDRPLVCMNSPVLLWIICMCSLSSVSVFSDFSSLDCLSKKVHVWISVLVLQTWTVRCVCVLQFLQLYPYSCGSPVCPIELHPSSRRAFTMLGTSAARSLPQILFDLWTAVIMNEGRPLTWHQTDKAETNIQDAVWRLASPELMKLSSERLHLISRTSCSCPYEEFGADQMIWFGSKSKTKDRLCKWF